MSTTVLAICADCQCELTGYESGFSDYRAETLVQSLTYIWEDGDRVVATESPMPRCEVPCELCGDSYTVGRFIAHRIPVGDDVITLADAYDDPYAELIASTQDHREYLAACYRVLARPLCWLDWMRADCPTGPEEVAP